MTIWLVTRDYDDHERTFGTEFLGIFATRDVARAWVEDKYPGHGWKGTLEESCFISLGDRRFRDDIDVEPYEVLS